MDAARRRPIWIACAVVGAVLLLLLGARLLAKYDHGDTVWVNAARSASGWQRPYDFAIFLGAANDVLAGRDPYPTSTELRSDVGSPYAYPPLLALVVTPLAVLPEHVASTFVPGVLFTLVLLAATVGALLLLDVRDWRCYAVVLLWPVTLQGVEYGAIGAVLLVLLAFAWRYRDHATPAAPAVGGAVVLKLFLWPVLLWLAFTRRLRTAALATATAVVLALVSWAAIAFRGLADYPHLLSRLSDVEARNSYSAYAVLRALGIPGPVSQALVVAASIALLALAWRAAREPLGRAFERDRRSFTFVLAAALVLTPILWLHYLVLLVLPIALARPRLSLLWFVPLAMTVFEALDWYGGWPRGDGRALGSVCVVVGLVFVGSLRSRSRAGDATRVAPVRA